MQFFYWNKRFEVGIESVDSRHRGLVDLINALAAVITDGGSIPEARSLFGKLMDYAAKHFREEELLMDASPLDEDEKERHRKAHRSFVEKVEAIRLRSDLMSAEVAGQVLEFLTTWLISHILGSDLKIAQVLKHEAGGGGNEEMALFEISPVERLLLGALTETERRFRVIADNMSVHIWVSDATGNRGFCNRSLSEFLGIKEGQPQGFDWAASVHPDDLEGYRARLEAMLTDPQPFETEFRLRDAGGKYHWFLERVMPRIDFNEVLLGFIASSTDISNIKQVEEILSRSNIELDEQVARRTEQLVSLMMTDALTGIGNRRRLAMSLDEEVQRSRRYQRPLSAVFFDIDHFKHVNDAHGHAVGDAVLAGVAATLRSCLRECDLVCRFGGEEFVILLPETGIEEATTFADRIRLEIGRMKVPQIPAGITASAGIAELGAEEGGASLLERCDRALYQAKEAGRDCCRVDRSDPGA
jgi:diguanylate cyclase (GGDEF)-like protein/hemerythrin-like metal-binding protein/PAS domain S-box-containing protein